MGRRILQRLLRPFCRVQEEEVYSLLLMFCYSFLAMSAYNIIQPTQRGLFINNLGALKIPYVQLAAGLFIGLVMTGYAWLMSRLPRRWCLPISQGGIVVLLVTFWHLFRTQPKAPWVAVTYYIFGLILGILLISQFWTLANVVYNPRQAKRLFGFIGGGSSLGGMLGGLITWFATEVGTSNLLLISAGLMVACMLVVVVIVNRENVGTEKSFLPAEERKGVGARRAIELLSGSKHLRLIALVISFGAIGAAILDQQFNMATEAFKRQGGEDVLVSFLGQIRFYLSAMGFLVQVLLTSRIHRFFGVGFALLLLPLDIGTTAAVILFNAALWAPSLARVMDQTLRYTIDKTTREILYMPLPLEIKYEAKPFVDVTLDRFAKGMTAVVLLVLISPWGFNLGWQKLSFVSLTLMVIWILVAVSARRGYQMAFRQSLEQRIIKPADVRSAVADLSTIEALVRELSSPDEERVLYAMEMLESFDKRSLITPLLLYHESPAVRIRALGLFSATLANETGRWLPVIQRMMADENPGVRAAAVGALANIHDEQVTVLVRPYLHDANPRIAITAAMVLSESGLEEDVAAAEHMLKELVADTRDSTAQARREFAIALRNVANPHFRRLLIPLLSDGNHEVAEEAMQTVRRLGVADFIFAPTLVSLLRNPRMKSSARELLVGCGEEVLGILGHFLGDPGEDIWVRRHIPDVIARIPCQKAMDILVAALQESDGLLRFRVLAAMERLHREDAGLVICREYIEARALKEGSGFLHYEGCYRQLFEHEKLPKDNLLARALAEKMERILDRTYRYLGLIYPWKDIAAARWAIEHDTGRTRSAALEYLDNLLVGILRKKLMPVLEAAGMPSLARDLSAKTEQTVLRLIHDSDPVLSSAAILFSWEIRLGNINSELEKLLASREARDWHVFEAASWVSAAFRLQESRRRLLWMEAMPAVEAADRMRGLPLFASLSIDSLFRIVAAGSQTRHEPGKALLLEGSVPECLNLVVDGRVLCRTSDGDLREITAPAILGFPEVLEGKPVRETVRTGETCACLSLTGEQFRTVLADDADLVQGLFRILLGADAGAAERRVTRGKQAGLDLDGHAAGLNAVEKSLVLKSIPVFSGVSVEEMPALASIAISILLKPEMMLFAEMDLPAIVTVISGQISLESERLQQALVAGPGDTIGVENTFAGISPRCNGRVLADGTALCIHRNDLFDLISQRPGLLSQLYAAASRQRGLR